MTIKELQEALDRAGVNPRRYDLDGGQPALSEGLVLAKGGDGWSVRHVERGSCYTLATFPSEADACASFLSYASDPFYKS